MTRRFRNPSQRRKVQWEGSTTSSATTNAIPGSGGSSSGATAWVRVPAGAYDNINQYLVESDWTLIRSIDAAAIYVQKTVSDGYIDVQVGMGVIAWDAIDDSLPNIADVPLPIQSPQYDWVWQWVSPMPATLLANGEFTTHQNLAGPEGGVFTRAQRKLSQGTGLLLVVEVLAIQGGIAGVWSFSHHSRNAFKLP